MQFSMKCCASATTSVLVGLFTALFPHSSHIVWTRWCCCWRMEKVIWKKEIKTCPFGDFLNKILVFFTIHMILNTCNFSTMTMLMVLMWIGRNSKIPAQNNWNNSLLGSGNAPQLRHSPLLQHQSATFHKITFGLCGKEQECELYCFPHSWWKMSEMADENYTDLWNKEFVDQLSANW